MENYFSPLANRGYKDRLFCAIFGDKQNRKYLLELYNALNNSNYANVNDIQVMTIDNAIYISVRNDIAFLIGSEINLYEHQSTLNPNMPLRGLMYFSQLYQMYLSSVGKDLYGSTLIKIPTPKFVVFYNGLQKIDDITTLKLSNAFEKPDITNGFEWTATMINVNINHNKSLLNNCKSLYNYSKYISLIRDNIQSGLQKEEAIHKAVDYAIQHNFYDGFFKKQRSEVMGMSLTEFNQEEFLRNRHAEALEEGSHKNKLETAKRSLEKNLPIELIADITGLTIEEVEKLKVEVSA